jgi:pimeloyl-[acyl-carrier protein] synthase
MPDFDILSDAFFDNPYPTFAEMRRDAPCYYDTRLEAHVLTRFRDVERALGGEEFSAERVDQWGKGAPGQVQDELAFFTRELKRWIPFNDPPVHTRLRTRLGASFGPHNLARIEQLARSEIAAGLDGLDPSGEVDLIRDYAFPAPSRILAGLMGIPSDDIGLFKQWTVEIFTLIGAGVATEEAVRTGHHGIGAMRDYCRALIDERRARPQDDIVSALIANGTADDPVTDDDIAGMVMTMIAAGHETTTYLIGNAVNAVMADARTREAVLGSGLAAESVEEFARFDGAVFSIIRRARADLTINGELVPQGAPVFCMLHSANRDPRVNRDPDRLDLARAKVTHVGFGSGIHKCIGSLMARTVVREAVQRLFERFPAAQPDGAPTWIRNLGLRGMATFPVRLGGA